MPKRTRSPFTPTRAATRAGIDALAIATGAPQVIATRLARMAAHGANPSPSDRREMHRMVDEKKQAFADAWTAMGAQSLRMQQAYWQSTMQTAMQTAMQSWWQPLMRPWWQQPTARAFTWPASPLGAMSPHGRHARAAQALASQISQGAAQIAAAGLAPVSRRVRSNVTRLGPQRKRG